MQLTFESSIIQTRKINLPGDFELMIRELEQINKRLAEEFEYPSNIVYIIKN
jgi:hypothetical protein